MTGAGMMDCKKALTEAEGDFEKAIEILRKKGQKVSASRSDKDAREGSVFVKTSDERFCICKNIRRQDGSFFGCIELRNRLCC